MKRFWLACAFALACVGGSQAGGWIKGQSYGFGKLQDKALGCFSGIHQHGPLYNYGPYYGYPPYTNNCSSGNCGGSNWGNWFHKNSCNTCGSSWGKYSLSTLKNVFHRTHPCGNKVGCTGCNTCN